MTDPFPAYDVLAKRGTPSWNAQTRKVIDDRLALAERSELLTARQLATLRALAARITPQPQGRPPVNVVAILLDAIADGEEGYRRADLPPALPAWRRGLDAIEAEAQARSGASFAALAPAEADALLGALQAGDTKADAWRELPVEAFWSWRLIPDLVSAFWAHPSAWSAMGFGGPASPRGYVRISTNRRDPWEAEERDER